MLALGKSSSKWAGMRRSIKMLPFLSTSAAFSGSFPHGALDTDEEIIRLCKEHTMFSWSAQRNFNPISMARAEGIYFWDNNGKRYTDMNAQLMCVNIGHQHPKVIQAIKDQADELCYAGPGMATRVRAEIGPLLAERTPGDLNKFFFTLGGSEANENALKLAKLHTGRNKVIVRYKAYHGATHGSAMMTGDARRWPHENMGMGGIIRVFDPYKYRSLLYKEGMPDEEFSALMVRQLEETILYENPNNIACMFLESVTGTNGLIPPPKGYLKGVRDVLTKYGILMVCDEVMCGLGRTGSWFACDQHDVVPDIITMAKGVTAAFMPLGVVAMSNAVSSTFDDKPFVGGLTYSGHPMCLAAGVATLKVLAEEKIVENAFSVGNHLTSILENMKRRHISVGDVRSVGLFACLELVRNRATKEPMSSGIGGAPDPAVLKMLAYLREHGVYIFNFGHIIHIIPPLVITKAQLDETFAIIDKALDIVDAAAAL